MEFIVVILAFIGALFLLGNDAAIIFARKNWLVPNKDTPMM